MRIYIFCFIKTHTHTHKKISTSKFIDTILLFTFQTIKHRTLCFSTTTTTKKCCSSSFLKLTLFTTSISRNKSSFLWPKRDILVLPTSNLLGPFKNFQKYTQTIYPKSLFQYVIACTNCMCKI